MAGHTSRRISGRMLERIGVLREEFGKNTASGPLLFHALIVFRDDLDESAFGPYGLLQQAGTSIAITLPSVEARHVSAFHGITVITPPVWTKHGRRFGAESAYRMLPEARRLLVEKPGVVADSFTVVRESTRACGERAERFRYLAADAGRVVRELRDSLALYDLQDYDFGRRSHEDDHRWLVTLHRLAWREDPESALHATRNTRVKGSEGGVSFFPHYCPVEITGNRFKYCVGKALHQ